MKRMIIASSSAATQSKDVDGYLRQAVHNIASFLYDNAPLSDEDPRADYFVENISTDSEVLEARDALLTKIMDAYDRQMRR